MNILAHKSATRSLHFDFTSILPMATRAYFSKEQRLARKLYKAKYSLEMAQKIMEKPAPMRSNLERNAIICHLEYACSLFLEARTSILFDEKMANKAIDAHLRLASEIEEFSKGFPYRPRKSMLRQGMAAIKKAMEIWIFKGDSPSFQALLEALNGAEARLNKLVDANMGWSKSVFAWILIKLGRIKKMFGGCLDAHFKTERAQ